MAEYDGSIRIGVKVDQENAQKQLENLKNRLASQTLEIGKQAKAAEKLRSKLSEMAQKTGKPEFVQELVTGLAKAEARAAELDQKIKEINAAEPGKISPESSQRMQELLRQMNESDAESDRLRASLSELDLKPTVENQLMEMARELGSTDANVDRLRESMQQTSAKISQAQATAANASQALKDMGASAQVSDQHIVDLRKELEELTQRKADLEAAGVGLGFKEYDDTAGRIREIKDELNAYSNSLGQADTKSESWVTKLGHSAKRLKDVIASTTKKAGSAVGGFMKRLTNLGRHKGFEKASKSASSFARRLKEIVKGALFFNIISRALTGLTNQLGKYLTANKDFSDALNGLKSNLMTAFQPIYEAAMPALTALMQGLEAASAKFAAFIATIFGTTASQAQQNAKDLYEQANAEEAVGDAAEDAAKQQKKFLASFDTIEKVGEEKSDTKTDKNKDEQKDKLNFDTAFQDVAVPQWLLDFWKVFQDSWNQYGETTMQAFRSALDGLKAAAESFGQVFMKVWTDGTGLAFLNQIQLLLQQILLMIGNIGTTFAQVWSSGVGEEVLHNLFGLLTTILGIFTSMAASFNAVWTSGAGEALLTALLTLLATILGIIGDIAGAFKSAWDSGAGTAALSAISFAITAVLTLLNSVGKAFRDAWNDNGTGERICKTILSIITGIFNVVGELANRFKEAWEINGNGQAIMAAILGIVQIILSTFDDIVQKTVEWARELNLEPLISSVRGFLEALEPLIQQIGDVVSGIWQDTVLPFLKWVTETALPFVIELLTDVITFLSDNFDTVKTFAGGIIALFAAFEGAALIAPAIKMIQKVITTVKLLFMLVQANPIIAAITAIIFAIGALIANWDKVKETVENVINAVVGFIQKAVDAVKDFWNSLTAGPSKSGGSFGGSRSSGYSSGYSSGAYSQSYAAAPVAYSEEPNAAVRLLYSPEMLSLSASPRMARAVETTPNTEYIASGVSSRNSGGGITMADLERVMNSAMSRNSGGTTKVDVNFSGSLAQLARVLRPEINVETQRLGPDLAG